MAYKTQSELETQLNIAKSNLQLVISNNEMLEEALKRETPCSARDVGWRRWSAREVQNMQNTVEERPKSLDYGPLNETGRPSVPSVQVDGAESSAMQPQAPMTSQESRLFKFRLGTSESGVLIYYLQDSLTPCTGLKSPPLPSHASHLTSPSLPSLISDTREREFQDLQTKYECERQAHQTVAAEKAALEAELESLSQALFEEVPSILTVAFSTQYSPQANKMVATERIKRAETEEELDEIRKEKDALRKALCLIEGENGLLRSASAASGAPSDHTGVTSSSTPPPDPTINVMLSPPSPEQQPQEMHGTAIGVDPTSHVDGLPDHLNDFSLQPATKAFALRRTQPSEKSMEDPAASAYMDHRPSTATLFTASFVPIIPDEISPWGDSSVSS